MSDWMTEPFFFGVAFRGVSASSASTAGRKQNATNKDSTHNWEATVNKTV